MHSAFRRRICLTTRKMMHSSERVVSAGALPGKTDLAFGAERFRLLSLGEKTDDVKQEAFLPF
jgi:hypothetical protein